MGNIVTQEGLHAHILFFVFGYRACRDIFNSVSIFLSSEGDILHFYFGLTARGILLTDFTSSDKFS